MQLNSASSVLLTSNSRHAQSVIVLVNERILISFTALGTVFAFPIQNREQYWEVFLFCAKEVYTEKEQAFYRLPNSVKIPQSQQKQCFYAFQILVQKEIIVTSKINRFMRLTGGFDEIKKSVYIFQNVNCYEMYN